MLILVLADGETWESIGGAEIVEVPDGLSIDEVEAVLDAETSEMVKVEADRLTDLIEQAARSRA